MVVLENVDALANSRGGDDLAVAVRELNRLGYSVDVVAIDARRFVPQPRPRLFLVDALDAPPEADDPDGDLHPDWLQIVPANCEGRLIQASRRAGRQRHIVHQVDDATRIRASDGSW